MTAPATADVRGGIRNWGGALGNEVDGDCVAAAFEQLRKTHEVTKASSFKKVVYKLGFRPPHENYTLAVYTEFLATQGMLPGPDAGIDPDQFFPWLLSKGMVKDWGKVPVSDVDACKQAVVDHHGCLLTVTLTPACVGSEAIPNGIWTVDSTNKNTTLNPQWGHGIAWVKYNPIYDICVTWGFIVNLTPEFWAAAVNGVYWYDL